jgi:hypothetical protein
MYVVVHEGEAGFREACFAPPQPAGCAKPAVEMTAIQASCRRNSAK